MSESRKRKSSAIEANAERARRADVEYSDDSSSDEAGEADDSGDSDYGAAPRAKKRRAKARKGARRAVDSDEESGSDGGFSDGDWEVARRERIARREASESAADPAARAAERRSRVLEQEAGDDRLVTSDMRKVQMQRHVLDKLSGQDDTQLAGAVLGCAVRVANVDEHGRSNYRLCIVSEVRRNTKMKAYLIEQYASQLEMRVAYGRQKKWLRLAYISNQPLSETEFTRWRNCMRAEEMLVPLRAELDSLRGRIKEARTRPLTNEQVDRMVELRQSLKDAPKNMAAEHAKLRNEVELAKTAGDAAGLEAKRASLEEFERLRERNKRDASETAKAVANVNRRNILANQKSREDAAKAAEIRNKTQDATANPFMRRHTRPDVLWTTTSSDGKEGNVEAAAAAKAAKRAAERQAVLDAAAAAKAAEVAAQDAARRMSNKEAEHKQQTAFSTVEVDATLFADF